MITTSGADVARARTLLFSQRNIEVHLWEAPQLEFEDVILEVEGARMLAPSLRNSGVAGAVRRGRNYVARQFHMPHRWPMTAMPVEEDYELFFGTFHFPKHISFIKRLPQLRERCRILAAHLIELWTPDVLRHARELRQLDNFDHIFVSNGRVVEPLSRLLGRPVHLLPTAVDALRFSPYPEPPLRCVDVYNYGRGSDEVHRQLLEMSTAGEIFYLHARVNHDVPDYMAHRIQVANIMKRSRYFFAYRVGENRPQRTGGDEALITRLFEGAAGGAVMLGSHPQCAEWEEYFGWPDALIPVPWQPNDLRALLRELDSDPARLSRISQENAVQSLLRHDWVYRWGAVLDTVGLPHTPSMHARADRLSALATAAVTADHRGAARAPHEFVRHLA